ncbi:possible integrase [Xanthomonas phage Xp15]|uniref:Possible integrase n=1 Tax=Xanthomonas phage Xp15 TaxID=322855 RepID=Q52PS4_9CAUD|nr:bifunctional DNA primase/polymerase [Xanthomonas phage Xp15]AAX84884.1 possible integrase [Xanthomonas phage Xp15]
MEQQVLHFAKRFARDGYYVFPFYGSSEGPQKPYGWARNTVTKEGIDPRKIIPATDDPEIVETWPELIAAGYKGAKLVGYGVLGVNCVIFDLDVKGGVNGIAEFNKFSEKYGIPKSEFVVKSKSGGFHLYYAKPEKLRSLAVKTVAGLTIGGTKYPGLDVRGEGGMVVGPMAEGQWVEGTYTIVKGNTDTALSEVPTQALMSMSKSSITMDAPEVLTPQAGSMDELEILKRGEIPDKVSNGNRNNGFYLYLNALRNKGFSQETARRYIKELIKVTENPETIEDSIDVEDMLARIWKIDQNNPYDVCRDLIEGGLYRLTNFRSKLMYVCLENNQYLDTKTPHDLTSMKQLMSRFARKMANQDGKLKLVNPIDVLDGMITPDREVATIGFKPGASEVFTITEAEGGKKYLNTWRDPRIQIQGAHQNQEIWDKFKFLVSRIFGPEGSEEYQLGIDFPAWLIQNPGIRPVIAPYVMSRVRGAGKSVYLSMLTQLFGFSKDGDMQGQMFEVDQIGGRFFNPNGASLLIFDEIQFPVHRNMRQESATFWRHLKSLITLETVPVEFKGGDTVQMPLYAGVVLAGNTGSNFPLEEFDRRIWLIDNDPPAMEEGLIDEFYDITKNRMSREQKREIIQGLLVSLDNHPIKLKLDRMKAPMNEIKREMYLSTLSDIEEWWITYFEDRDNLLARTPVLTKSAVIYLISIAERLMNSRWREDPEGTFRELKRRGLLQPIRTKGNNYQTRNMRNVPIVKGDGGISQEGEGRDVLYTTRQHGDLNDETNEAILQMYLANVNGINKWKRESILNRSSSIASSL